MRYMIFLTLLFVFPLVVAEDDCRNMNAHGAGSEWQGPCELDSDYDFCLIQSLRGTINGTWASNYMNGWLVLLEDVAEVPTHPDAVESRYNRSVEVFNTKQGMVLGEAQFVYDLRTETSDGGIAIPVVVTGGTGMYEDASVWITVDITSFDQGGVYSVDGRVCEPNLGAKGSPHDLLCDPRAVTLAALLYSRYLRLWPN